MRLGITHKADQHPPAGYVIERQRRHSESWIAPYSWRTSRAHGKSSGGQLMNDAIQTAQGKPDSARCRVIYIGTLAPYG